jgi:type I restriction enzyme S subunit
MNETLETMARAIFKDWFVDFGPVRAKAEGCPPPGLVPDIAALFPDKLDDDDKPVGWAIGTVEDIARLNPESWTTSSAPEAVEYVDLANTKWGIIESTAHYEWEEAPSRARRVLRLGDTIVGTVRPGNGSYAFIGCDGLTGSTGFAVLRPKKHSFREMVYYAATCADNIERLSHLADGAAYPAVRPEVVGATGVVACPEEIITAFSALTSPFLDRVEANKRENATLAALRDLLLPKLMSGEIRLKDVEQTIAGTA